MKDIMGAALLGELLAALARSSALRTSLGGVPAEAAETVVRTMVGEVERLAAEGAAHPAPPVHQKPALYPTAPPAPRKEDPVRKPFPAPEAHIPAPPPPVTPSLPEIKKDAPPRVVSTQPGRIDFPEPPASQVRPAATPTPPVEVPRTAAVPPPVPPPVVEAKRPAAVPPPVPPPVVEAKRPAAVPPPVQPPVVEAKRPAAVPPPVPPPVVEAKRPAAVPPPVPPGAVEVKQPAAVPLPVPPPVVEAKRPAATPVAVQRIPTPPSAPEPPSPLTTPSARVRVAFDAETAFVLAAALIPLQDTPSPDPFGIGTEGVERGSEIFVLDHAGMRFFLSTLKNQEASVSRTGMLLLGKQESIKHRGVHEAMMNALRLRSLVLPAEPGTVVFGRNDLVRRVDFRRDALFEILVGLSTLSSWRVAASVLDAHVQKILPAEASPARAGRHDTERSRVSPTTKKTDIKTLERLLNREKKLAEAILQRLAAAADSHTVESMVGLASGSSEDWKPILKASFEVPAGRFARFAQAVVDCQETHAMFEPMLSVVGGPGSFSLSM